MAEYISKTITIRDDQHDRIEREADRHACSFSQALRMMLAQYMRDHPEGDTDGR